MSLDYGDHIEGTNPPQVGGGKTIQRQHEAVSRAGLRVMIMRLGEIEVRLAGDSDDAIRDSAEFAALHAQGYGFGGSFTKRADRG